MDPLKVMRQLGGPSLQELRCICVGVKDLSWIKKDCSYEYPFVFDGSAMKVFPNPSTIDGCDAHVNLETLEEIESDEYPKGDPNYQLEEYEIVYLEGYNEEKEWEELDQETEGNQ